MGLTDFAQDLTHGIETRLAALSSGLADPVIRIGVTGLARAGKTVFITSLVSNLLDRGRMAQLRAAAEGRIEAAWLQPQPDDTVATLILDGSGDAMRYLARSLILAWYLGSWYDPADLERAATTPPPRTGTPPPPNVVISAAAYTQGWAWRVAQAHPMGYSTFSFGYWSSLPPALDAIVGGASS